MECRASLPNWTGETPVPPSSFLEFRLRIQTLFDYALPAVAAIAFGGSGLFWAWAWTWFWFWFF
jgi:hypothetical protein